MLGDNSVSGTNMLLYPDGMRHGYNASSAAGPASPLAASSVLLTELTGAQRLDLIGSALQDLGNGMAGLERRPQDAAALEAMQRQLQQQQETFAQQVRFGQTPAPYRQVTPVTLNTPAGAPRPGDRAIGALASLYR